MGRFGSGGGRARWGVSMGALVAAVALASSSCAIPIADLGGPSSQALGINDVGVIVGASELPGSTSENRLGAAFVRTPDGTVTQLPTIPGATQTGAVAINDRGQIAGTATIPGVDPAPDEVHVVWWDAAHVVHDLGTGGGDPQVRAIDDQGRIIGWFERPNPGKAFVVDVDGGGFATLPDIADGGESVALGSNDEGDVVGYQWEDPPEVGHPVRWDLDAGTVTDLFPRWGPGLLADIDDDGTVVGLRKYPPDDPLGVVDAAILRPGDPSPTRLSIGDYPIPVAIEDGVVVGFFRDSPSPPRGYRWDAVNGFRWLTGPDEQSNAWALNSHGQIVGEAGGHAALLVATG